MAATVLAAATLAVVARPRNTSSATSADDRRPLLAVMPFRVSGAPASVAYLRGGMADVIAARVSDEDGWRVDQPATLDKLRALGSATDLDAAEALDLAASLGAREVLAGDIVGAASRIEISATLRSVADGAVEVAATASGPIDSLPALVDRVAARLLFSRARYAPANPDLVARKPLPVLREFLRGYVALRSGRYTAAIPAFQHALDLDSTFAQGWLELAAAARHTGDWGPWMRGLSNAWDRRKELGRADSLYLVALAGNLGQVSATQSQTLHAWEQVVEARVDGADGYYELGDDLLRWGPIIGVPDNRSRARAALSRSLELDSSVADAVVPRMEIAIDDGDTATVRTLFAKYVATGAAGEMADYLRWRAALFFGDDAARQRVASSFDHAAQAALLNIVGMGQIEGIGMPDVARAIGVLRQRAAGEHESGTVSVLVAYWALNRGDVAAALTTRQHDYRDRRQTVRDEIADALYGGGDTLAAKGAVPELERLAREFEATNPGAYAKARERTRDLCVTEQWRLWHRQPTSTGAVIAELRAAGRPEGRICSHLLAALDAVLSDRPNADSVLEELDSQARLGDRPLNDFNLNLPLAWLWERRGQTQRALAAVRRRPFHHWSGAWYLSSYLETEQRLAGVAGDSAGAQRARRHLAALRAPLP